MKMTPARWRARIERSLELQKVRKEEAERFLRAYAGDYNEKPKKSLDGNKDDASVNYIYAFVETVRPTLLPGTPKAFVEAEEPSAEPQSEGYQAVINHWARRLGIKKEFKKIIHDWFFGYGAFLTEWDYSEEPSYKEDGSPEIDPESISEENPEGEQAFKIMRDQPIAKRLNPWDVLVDPDSQSREEDRWRARRIIMTYSEFKGLPGITPEMRKKIRPRTMPRELMRAGEDNATSTEKNWVILWRIYDLENYCTKLLCESDAVDEFVEDMPWPWEMDVGGDRFPVTILDAKWDYDNPYSFSGFKAFWGSVQERNALRTILKSVVRRNAPGWFAKKGAMDEEQKEKFTGSKIGEYIEANMPDQIVAKPEIKVSTDFFAHDGQVAMDADQVSGLTEFRTESTADTATEASIQNQKSSIRKGEAKTEFNDFCAVIYSKLGQLNQQFLQMATAVKIRSPEGPEDYRWLEVTGDGIQGEFYLTVKPGADEAETEGLRRQQDLKYAELMAGNPEVDQRKMAIRISKRHDIEPEEILKPEGQAQAEMQQAAAAEAAAKAPKQAPPEVKPLIDFSSIKVELLAPHVQELIIRAALLQNQVPETLAGGGAASAGQPALPGEPPSLPATPSVDNAAPSQSMLPGMELNQAPPSLPGADLPPASPISPMSEGQGGSV